MSNKKDLINRPVVKIPMGPVNIISGSEVSKKRAAALVAGYATWYCRSTQKTKYVQNKEV